MASVVEMVVRRWGLGLWGHWRGWLGLGGLVGGGGEGGICVGLELCRLRLCMLGE